MIGKTKRPVIALAALVVTGILLAWGSRMIIDSYPKATDAMKPFDSASPGLGLDLYRNEVEEHAMAYALYASAAAMLGMAEQARVAGDWLVDNPASDTKVGWGLPFAWDAFGDDSTNPATTVYGVTTALAVRGLFDVYDLTEDETYRETAIKALEDYLPYFHESEHGGYFGYSDQPTDQTDTHNISGILMGQYARATHYTSDHSFREIAEKTKRHLDATRHSIGSHVYWPYSTVSDRPNDLVHAAYISQGYVDYARHLDDDLDVSREVDYLTRFFEEDSVKEFPNHSELPDEVMKRPGRGWGVGMLIYTLADHGNIEAANKAARALESYRVDEHIFATTPERDEFVPRIQSHVAFGLARLEAAKKSQ